MRNIEKFGLFKLPEDDKRPSFKYTQEKPFFTSKKDKEAYIEMAKEKLEGLKSEILISNKEEGKKLFGLVEKGLQEGKASSDILFEIQTNFSGFFDKELLFKFLNSSFIVNHQLGLENRVYREKDNSETNVGIQKFFEKYSEVDEESLKEFIDSIRRGLSESKWERMQSIVECSNKFIKIQKDKGIIIDPMDVFEIVKFIESYESK